MPWYIVSIGNAQNRQYVAHAMDDGHGDGGMSVTWTHKREAAAQFLHFATSRVVRFLLQHRAGDVHIEEVE